MRDHGEFILTSLSYNEQNAIRIAKFFKDSFSRLHEQSKQIIYVTDINALNLIINECMNLLLNFINFKKQLLGRLLKCQLNTSLPPTFYNHMINEAMQFYKALIKIKSDDPVNPVLENLQLHRIWLPDAAGHAVTIANNLDPVEKMYIIEAEEFEKSFNNLALKVEELFKMLVRTRLSDGVLHQFNEDVKKKIVEFNCYLDKIRKLKIECRILGILKPLVPDHMIREENYYLSKIEAFG